LQEEQFVWQ